MMNTHRKPIHHQWIHEIGRQSDESQGHTIIESTPFNTCDGVRHGDPHQGSAMNERIALDDGKNGGMKDDFRGTFRGFFMTKETMISVDGMASVGK